jgi:long-chain fatty acid transport protein
MTIKLKRLVALSCVFLCASVQSFAAGFALQEQSVSGLGNAFAGGAAAAEDNSVLFTNPAALTLMDGSQVQVGVHMVMPKAELTNTGTTTLGVPTQGANQTSDEGAMVPNLYYSQKVGSNMTLGLAVNVPFGLATEWGDEWFGRYIADRSELHDINIQPTLAYKISDKFSIGVGANYANVSAELSNAVDMGLVFLNAVQSGAIPAQFVDPALLGSVQQNLGSSTYDGYFKVEGDDAAWGYNIGVLFQPSERIRVGLHYRSAIKFKLEGDADFTVGALEPYLGSIFQDGKGSVDLELPSITNFSIHYQIDDKWAVMADAQYTTWSSFDYLVIEYEQQTPPDTVVPELWEDVWRLSAGVTYTPNSTWTVRGGFAFDESPVPGPRYRSPRIPDADRTWFTGGVDYKVNDNFTLNASAAYITVTSPTLQNDTHSAGQVLVAEMDASVTIFSVAGNFRF